MSVLVSIQIGMTLEDFLMLVKLIIVNIKVIKLQLHMVLLISINLQQLFNYQH